MRTLRCAIILGWRHLGFAFPERDANPVVHTYSGLAKPGFRIPRTRCEPYGAYSFWVGDTLVLYSEKEMRTMLCALILGFAKPMVLHSQNELRTLWCILILGWRNLSLGFPGRDANRMVHSHSGLAKPRFCIPRTRCEPYGPYSFWVWRD